MSLAAIFGDPSTLPHDSKVPDIYALNITFVSISCIFIMLRMFVRVHIVQHVAVEDYLMVAAGLFATIFSTMSLIGIKYGLGLHVWDLPEGVIIENAKKIIQTLWICQVMYSTALTLVKLSIIASYHRIFPTFIHRQIMYVMAGLIMSVYLVSIFTTIFQCTPITGAWNFTAVPRPKCISIMKVYYFTTAFSILTDLLLTTLPLPLFWKLDLPTREKWIVSFLFGCGLIATVASAMRISTLHDVQSMDVTRGAVPTLNWSVVEVGTGIICACITCLKPLFRRIVPAGRSYLRSGHSQQRPSRIGYVESCELTKPPSSHMWSTQPPLHKSTSVTTTQQFV